MGIGNEKNNIFTSSLIIKDDFNFYKKNHLENNKETKEQNVIDNYSENMSLLIFCLSTACYGINNFLLKFINYIYGESYDVFSFGFWRAIALILLMKAIMKIKNIEIIPLKIMDNNIIFWLGIRTIGQFASLIFFMGCLENLRVGTANCFVSMNPVAVLIISTFLLNEKFYWRYPIGIGICVIGVFIIILNEGRNNVIEKDRNRNILLGIFWGILNLISVAMLSVSSKILNKAKIENENQCYYIGVTNAICFFIFLLLNGKFNYSFSFILVSTSNSIIFLTATYLLILSLVGVDLNKTTPLNYLSIVVSTFLSIKLRINKVMKICIKEALKN